MFCFWDIDLIIWREGVGFMGLFFRSSRMRGSFSGFISRLGLGDMVRGMGHVQDFFKFTLKLDKFAM